MRSISRSQVDTWLLLGMAVGLFGCPLLLDDDFALAPFSLPDAGDPCIGPTCHVPHSNLGGSTGEGGSQAGGAGGNAGAPSGGTGGSSGAAGNAGSSGSAGAGGAGAGGSAGEGGDAGSSTLPTAGSSGGGSAGAGSAGAAGASGEEEDACRTLELTDGSHDSSSNCLGIAGTNIIARDTNTSLSLDYDQGDPCFTGTIAATGWGATFEMELAPGSGSWNANTAGVSGFEFTFRGTQRPPSVRVIYKMVGDSDDYCRTVTPTTNEVPFTAGHPNCSLSGDVINTTQLDELILAFTPSGGSSYPVDFCVQIRALD